MSKIRKQWISREEFLDYIAGGRFPLMTIDFGNVGGLTAGSIPFANASGFLDEDNAALFWDAAQDFLGIGIGAPVCREHIRGVACADYAGIHPDTILLVENDDHVYIQLQAADNANAGIMFADDDFNPPAGMIRYDFANDWIEFGVGTNEILQLKAGPTFGYAGTLTLAGIVTITGTNLNLQNNAEIRFYDNGNYVGFEAPALTANQIWVLPDEDGDAGNVIITSGGGVLSFSPAGAGDVTAGAVLADHTLIRGDGGAKGIQDSGIDIDDADNITFPDGASINLQEDITFLGATTENLIKFPDNLPDAFSFMEGANPYQTFITTNGSEAVQFHKKVGFGIVAPDYPVHVYGTTATTSSIMVQRESANAFNPYVYFRKSRAGLAACEANDDIGQLTFFARNDVPAWHAGARLFARVLSVVEDSESYQLGFILNDTLVDYEPFSCVGKGNVGFNTATFGANAVKVMAMASGTPPTTSPVDAFQMYSADQVGGNACLHTRTENGAVIKLYQCAKVDYNNWAAFGDVVDALVAMGIFDAS